MFLIEPYVLGKMIDGLLIQQYQWLFVFCAICIIGNVFMYKRMVFDTKIFSEIYNTIILRYLKKDIKTETSAKIARTDLAHNVINFLESDVHYYIYAVLSIIGSLFFIFLGDIVTGLVVAICVIPIVYTVKCLYKKIEQSTRVGNNQYEQKVDILTNGTELEVDTFFKRRKKLLISSSTLQGKNWFALNSIKTLFLILAILMFTKGNSTLTQGQTVAMYSYINQFLISLMSIPIAVETFTRIKDVINRIKAPLSN
jgi:hypothetical protein